MEYMSQIEKLYKFFEFTLEFEDVRLMYKMKHSFNNDLNLIGCFLKDFLTIKRNGIIPDDKAIYNNIVLWLEENENNSKNNIKEIYEYSKYYLKIIFEEFDDKEVSCAVSTINACFAIDVYPNLMYILNEYYIHKADIQTLYKMLELLTDIVLKRYEKISDNILSYNDVNTRIGLEKQERAVV